MTRHLPFICLLLCLTGCTSVATKVQRVPTVLNPAEATPVATVQYAAPLVVQQPPPPILIPIKWPGDWTNYQWQVYASTNLLDWQLVVTNADMTAVSIDVPNVGPCGFYRLQPVIGTYMGDAQFWQAMTTQ